MKITDIMLLLGGLGLFLYGMQMMGKGLEDAVGDKMKSVIEKLTANRFLGVAVGAIITMLIQSSSATTVMVVGFVNAKMMTLRQAVWIIMGANIGTTITGQLIALDVGEIAPLFAFIGIGLIVFQKNEQLKHYGNIVAGLGILFIGMGMMSDAMAPLRDYQPFINLMTTFKNPIIGILVGAVFTAIIQSSSASVGILQTLAKSGLIDLSGAVYVLFGQNIGTCITAILASIGSSTEAKRTTVIHLSFNIIGTIIFTIVCLTLPLVPLVESWSLNDPTKQIANMHTLFNIATTLLLIPFGTYLADFATKVLPEKNDENAINIGFKYLQTHQIDEPVGSAALVMNQLDNEIKRMFTSSYKCVLVSKDIVLDNDLHRVEKLEKYAELVDYLDEEIPKYITNNLSHEGNNYYINRLSRYYMIITDISRIKDHSMNIYKYSKRLHKHNKNYDDACRMEIENLYMKLDELVNETDIVKVNQLDREIHALTKEYRNLHIERMRNMKVSGEVSMYYSQALIDFDRIANHIATVLNCVNAQ